MTKPVNFDFSDTQSFSYWFYVHDKDVLAASGNSMQIWLSESGDFSKYFVYDFSAFKYGWNHINLSKSQFINNGGANWNNPVILLAFVFTYFVYISR